VINVLAMGGMFDGAKSMTEAYKPLTEDMKAKCFDENNGVIEGCECHPTCMLCGNKQNPTGPDDCLACKDGSEVKYMNDESFTGSCGGGAPGPTPTTEDMKAKCFDENGVIEGCECHPTCGECGYKQNPTGPDDCIECKDGSEVKYMNDESFTGSCGGGAPGPTPT